MTETVKFTPPEWQTLQFAPLWAFSLVAGIDGKVDEDELRALLTEIGDAVHYKSPLVREVLMSLGSDFFTTMNAYKADSRAIDVGLSEAAGILDAKVEHTEALMFKGALMGIAFSVAKASGPAIGDKVSIEEQAAIVMLGSALHFDPAEFNQVAPTYHAYH